MKILSAIKKRVLNFLYNEDRAIASAIGAPPQETLSSEIGRHQDDSPVIDILQDTLDTIQKDHTKKAIAHADRLNKADDGVEQ